MGTLLVNYSYMYDQLHDVHCTRMTWTMLRGACCSSAVPPTRPRYSHVHEWEGLVDGVGGARWMGGWWVGPGG